LKKVLLISYYFDPFKGVGAKRMGYWANAFWGEPNPRFECTVITATPQVEQKNNVIFVEDKKDSLIDRFIQGISWVPSLKRYFRSTRHTYDYIIISGGPFGHFWISRYLKRNNGKVILDFRDPFARNSRFNTFFVKDYIKIAFEKAFLKYAGHVITVNDYCKNLLLKNVSSSKISIIENGYDEKILDKINSIKYDDGMIHLVYAGSFYDDRDPTIFVKQHLEFSKHTQKFILHHIGSPSEFLAPFKGSICILEHGEKNYKETMEIIKKCDVGLIVTKGDPMESTTKIYDYIGCDLDIIVITNGTIKTGSINGITSKVAGKTFWLKNNQEGILEFLKSYSNNGKSIPNRAEFSRQHGYTLLKDILQKV
jgi:glycosyltransferase involved in cell wall biosynthesis